MGAQDIVSVDSNSVDPHHSAAVATDWDNRVEDYETLFEPVTAEFGKRLLAIAGGVVPGEHVLDVAAGTGALSIPIAQAGARLMAVDISPAMVDRLAGRLKAAGLANAETRVMDGQALKLADGQFDAAFSAFGVMLFADYRAGLRELTRIVRAGGKVAVAVWAQPEGGPAAAPFLAAFHRAFPDRPIPAVLPGVAALSDRRTLLAELEEAGIERIRIETSKLLWAAPTGEWLQSNLDRVFCGHPIWSALSCDERKQLLDALVDGASALENSTRAWLAVGRKATETVARPCEKSHTAARSQPRPIRR